MITDPGVNEYINSLSADLPEYLDRLEVYAEEHHVPIIRKEAQNLLCFLIREKKPSNILEIGTAIGFSAQLMASVSDAHVTTIEKVEMRLKEARKNIAQSPVGDRITLVEGDALKVLEDLKGPFDFVFLDAAQGQYMNFLPHIMRLMEKGALLVTDNVLQEGSLAGSKFAVERRDRTIHMRMREFLYHITHTDELDTVILPVGDGMALSRKL